MKIRSVTLGNNLTWPVSAGEFAKAARFFERAKAVFGEGGIEVQTVRLAAQPLRTVRAEPVQLALAVESACKEHNIGYCSLGPASHDSARIAELIRSTSIVFASMVTAQDGAVDFDAVRAAAAVIHDVAGTTDLGFGNLRFGALAHCGPNIPFFPAAYHDGGHPKFTLALQCADIAVEAFSGEDSLAELERRFADGLVAADRQLYPLAKQLEREFAIEFLGADFCPAPFPSDQESIGGAVERFGVERFGAFGTLFAAAAITRTVRSAPLHRWGFNGLMLPVLEDSVLAARTADGSFSVNDLLLYSAVCGTGLDALPIPGDTSADEIAALILDVSALSVALERKPLTVRLLPVPGRGAGEPTEYAFDYFANGRVLPVKGLAATKLFARANS
ncbi:MAG: DUF711 family protein, partial [Chloroflexota bacterium]|nr:DUF711 family protein [Chloroflexota bacterium]